LKINPATDYRLDFKRFSLVSRPDGERYAFSLDGLGRRQGADEKSSSGDQASEHRRGTALLLP
jgi:hypothetical protein